MNSACLYHVWSVWSRTVQSAKTGTKQWIIDNHPNRLSTPAPTCFQLSNHLFLENDRDGKFPEPQKGCHGLLSHPQNYKFGITHEVVSALIKYVKVACDCFDPTFKAPSFTTINFSADLLVLKKPGLCFYIGCQSLLICCRLTIRCA